MVTTNQIEEAKILALKLKQEFQRLKEPLKTTFHTVYNNNSSQIDRNIDNTQIVFYQKLEQDRVIPYDKESRIKLAQECILDDTNLADIKSEFLSNFENTILKGCPGASPVIKKVNGIYVPTSVILLPLVENNQITDAYFGYGLSHEITHCAETELVSAENGIAILKIGHQLTFLDSEGCHKMYSQYNEVSTDIMSNKIFDVLQNNGVDSPLLRKNDRSVSSSYSLSIPFIEPLYENPNLPITQSRLGNDLKFVSIMGMDNLDILNRSSIAYNKGILAIAEVAHRTGNKPEINLNHFKQFEDAMTSAVSNILLPYSKNKDI